jgi:hypothetical protein
MTRATLGNPLHTGARALISGTISNGATWYEDVEITADDEPITDAENWEWRIIIRKDYDSPAALTLSTDDDLTIVQGVDATVLQIRVPLSSLANVVEGDYLIDLASQDTDDLVIHWGHGQVSFIDEPLGFT